MIIVFLTAHPEFIRTGYEVKAFDYLFKERIEKELPGMVGSLLSEVDENEKRIYGMVLVIRNTFFGELLHADGDLITTKENKEDHGLGFENVKYAVSKYNGIIQRRSGENIFQVSIVLYR